MSIYLSIDGGEPTDLASNQGWSQFVAWASDLDDADALRHLCEYGWYEPASDVAEQLTAALAEDEPDKDVVSVGENLLSLAEGDAVLTVTDGLSGDDERKKVAAPSLRARRFLKGKQFAGCTKEQVRGQPENAGQFASSPGGSEKNPESGAKPSPSAKAEEAVGKADKTQIRAAAQTLVTPASREQAGEVLAELAPRAEEIRSDPKLLAAAKTAATAVSKAWEKHSSTIVAMGQQAAMAVTWTADQWLFGQAVSELTQAHAVERIATKAVVYGGTYAYAKLRGLDKKLKEFEEHDRSRTGSGRESDAGVSGGHEKGYGDQRAIAQRSRSTRLNPEEVGGGRVVLGSAPDKSLPSHRAKAVEDEHGHLHADDSGQFTSGGGGSSKESEGESKKAKAKASLTAHFAALGSKEKVAHLKSVDRKAASKLLGGANTATIRELQRAAGQSPQTGNKADLLAYTHGAATKETVRPASDTGSVDVRDPKALAAAVTEAAYRTANWTGKPYEQQGRAFSHSPLIADLYAALKDQLGGASLDEFKAGLLKAHQAGDIVLSRNDLPHAAHDQGQAAASEIAHLNAAFHKIDVPATRPVGAAKPPKPANTGKSPAQSAEDMWARVAEKSKVEKKRRDAEAVADVVKEIAGESGQAPLHQVRKALAERGVTDRAAQDVAIQAARGNTVSASNLEGRHGISDEEREAAIAEDGGKIGFLAIRQGKGYGGQSPAKKSVPAPSDRARVALETKSLDEPEDPAERAKLIASILEGAGIDDSHFDGEKAAPVEIPATTEDVAFVPEVKSLSVIEQPTIMADPLLASFVTASAPPTTLPLPPTPEELYHQAKQFLDRTLNRRG